jgi:hypothetical protein
VATGGRVRVAAAWRALDTLHLACGRPAMHQALSTNTAPASTSGRPATMDTAVPTPREVHVWWSRPSEVRPISPTSKPLACMHTWSSLSGSPPNSAPLTAGLPPSQVPWATATSTYAALLPPEELLVVKQAGSPELTQQRLLARVLMRTSLAAALGGSGRAQDLQFRRNSYGKPFLTSAGAGDSRSLAAERSWDEAAGLGSEPVPLLQHNLSHTTGLVGEPTCFKKGGGIVVSSQS